MQQLAIDFTSYVLKKLDQDVPKLWVLEEWYREFRRGSHLQIGIHRINQEVAWYYELESEDLRVKTRKEPVVTYRQIAQYVMTEYNHTHEQIAHWYGQDQSSIANAKKKIQGLMQTDKLFRKNVENILLKILNIR